MSDMKNFWLSWYCPPDQMGKFELHWPWWVSGVRMSDDAETICAAVRAEDEDGAKMVIIASFDEPRPDELEWRFVEEQPDDWTPFCDRFRKADWMQWPDTGGQKMNTLPDCMAPDGAEPCKGFHELKDERDKLSARLALLDQMREALKEMRAALLSDPPDGGAQKDVYRDHVIYRLDGQKMYRVLNGVRDLLARIEALEKGE